MKTILVCLVFVVFCSPPIFRVAVAQQSRQLDDPGPATRQESTGEATFSPESIERSLEGPVDADDIAAASDWAAASGVTDWLGPLAPVALSPFFGVTCLSGLALWGPSWISDNALLGAAGPLGNEWLFVIFLVLTLLTSLPRLTKVSKPFAQAVDRMETYAVIIILLAIKFVMSMDAPVESSTGVPVAALEVPVFQLGVLSFTLDTLLSIAMIINVLVINSVKFFFEFMVWLTPVPFLDAVFELSNKSLCAALMAIYAFSPAIATCINLVFLLAAALMLRWISRRVRFYRTMILDPVLAKLWSGFGRPKKPELIVFPQDDFGPFPAKSRLRMLSTPDGIVLRDANWWMAQKSHVIASTVPPSFRRGWVMHQIEIQDQDSLACLKFSRRYADQELIQILKQLGIDHDADKQAVQANRDVEFA